MAAQERASRRKRKHGPKIGGVDVRSKSPLARSIREFANSFARDQFLEIAKDAGKGGKPGIKLPPGLMRSGVSNEQAIMQGLGWYWEPLLHDLAFMEGMRDSIALLAGAYQKFTDLIMEGFALQSPDPEVAEDFTELLIENQQVDLGEVVRSCAFELLTLANAYRKPIFERGIDGKPTIKTFRPIRATAMRKLRDDDLVTQGYVQLLHRPSEFIFGGTPQVPTIYLADEIACGIAFTDGWYAYGKPPLASLPYVMKMKLQMERDLAEMMHQHVPRIDITFSPDDQMNDDQVQTAVSTIKSDVSGLDPTDNFVHTPDTEIEYKGPQGKGMVFDGPMNHVELQFFAVLPFGPGIMGRDFNINPMMSGQQWRLTIALANHIRNRIKVMLQPTINRLADERGVPKDARPVFIFRDLDPETGEIEARTDEYKIQNASAKRDAGFISQDDAAKDATKHKPEGPVDKAHAPGPIAPPVDPNKVPPSGKVGNSGKGPKDKNRSAPTPDKRPKGKRHGEELDDIFDHAEEELSTLDAATSENTEEEDAENIDGQ